MSLRGPPRLDRLDRRGRLGRLALALALLPLVTGSGSCRRSSPGTQTPAASSASTSPSEGAPGAASPAIAVEPLVGDPIAGAQIAADPEPQATSTPPALADPTVLLEPSGPLALAVEAQLRLQPERARTSNNLVEGTVSSVAFFGPHGEYLVAGGNDDRIHLAEIASGRELWASRPLGKDVQAVAACGEYFAGLTYDSRLAIYRKPRGRAVTVESTHHSGGSKWLAFTEGCEHLLTAVFLGPLLIYDRQRGALVAELPARGYRNFAYLRGQVIYRRPGATYDLGNARYDLYRWDTSPAQGTTLELPYAVEDDALGLLVQIQPTAWGGLLREYCDRERCRVILDRQGGPPVAVDFAVAGGIWTLQLGSRIALSSGGEFLAWYRDGLPVTIVDLASGRRLALPPVPRTMSATVDLAFDPGDPRRLAVTMHPAPNQVTIYRLSGSPGAPPPHRPPDR